MSTSTKDRLSWVLYQLDNLNNGGNIRYDGNTTFQGARGELADIINTYVDHSADPAPVILAAMTSEQLAGVVAELVKTSDGIVSAITAQIEQSDLTVIDAVAHTRADILAAVVPPVVATVPAE